MKAFRLLLIIAATLGLVIAISLPDREENAPASAYRALSDHPLRQVAEAEREAGRRGSALLALDYIVDNALPDAAVAAGMRERMLGELQADSGPVSILDSFGHSAQPARLSAFESLAGSSVADLIMYGRVQPAIAQAEARKDVFMEQLLQSREIAAAFPPAGPALVLIKAATLTGALTPELQKQMSEALVFIRSSGDSSMAVASIQDSIMPVYQLARKCRTWAEFDLMLRQAQSVEQAKIMVRIAGLSATSSKQAAQALLVAGAGPLSGRIVDHVIQYGPEGLGKLHAAVRKGPPGLELALRHPEIPLAALTHVRDAGLRNELAARWMEWRRQAGPAALAAKYGAVVALCLLLLAALKSGLPKAALGTYGRAPSYWLGAFAVSVGVGLLFFLIALAPSAPQAGKAPAPEGLTPGIPRPAAAAAASGSSVAPIAIIAVAILVAQGICWAAAQRRLREIVQNPDFDRTMKARQLENSDIFFDLPLYCGLAFTILSFILITTFRLDVTRFMAYSSTLVGIIMAVSLRIFLLHPIKERLITQKD